MDDRETFTMKKSRTIMKTPHMSTGKGDRARTWGDVADAVAAWGTVAGSLIAVIGGALIVAMT